MEISKASSVPASPSPQATAAQKAQQEAKETPAQTAKEASQGDAQARRLLAREDAQKANTAEAPKSDAKDAGVGVNVDVNA